MIILEENRFWLKVAGLLPSDYKAVAVITIHSIVQSLTLVPMFAYFLQRISEKDVKRATENFIYIAAIVINLAGNWSLIGQKGRLRELINELQSIVDDREWLLIGCRIQAVLICDSIRNGATVGEARIRNV